MKRAAGQMRGAVTPAWEQPASRVTAPLAREAGAWAVRLRPGGGGKAVFPLTVPSSCRPWSAEGDAETTAAHFRTKLKRLGKRRCELLACLILGT